MNIFEDVEQIVQAISSICALCLWSIKVASCKFFFSYQNVMAWLGSC